MSFRRTLLKSAAVLGILLISLFLATQIFNESLPALDRFISETEPAAESLTFFVFGDSGSGSGEQRTLAERIAQEEAEFGLHTGDVAYPCGSAERYSAYFSQIYESRSSVPIYPSPGNHDYQCDGLASYLDFFSASRFYSFDEDGVHFVSLDSNQIDAEQLEWLEEDLAESVAEIKVAFFHHPPFSSGSFHGGNQTVEQRLVPLFERYGVDLVFSGHEHNYERLLVKGIIYFVTGGGGRSVYQFGSPVPDSRARLADYHYVRVEIEGCEARTAAVRRDGSEFDPASIQVCE